MDTYVPEILVVKMTLAYPGCEVDAKIIEDLLVEHQARFKPLFERVIDVDDGRVQFVEESVEVEHIEFDDERQEGGCAEVEFMSAYYAGCKDLNSNDWHSQSLPFRIENGVLIFEIEIPARWRVDN